MRIAALAGASLLALTLTACGPSDEESMNDSMKDAESSMTDSSPAMTDHMGDARSGDFAGLNGKKVKGTVKVADGKVVLSGFSSDEGPDLHLYLAKGDDEAAVMAGESLGKVSYDTASQTFELKGVDASDFDTVVVHCDKAKAVFGAAALS